MTDACGASLVRAAGLAGAAISLVGCPGPVPEGLVRPERASCTVTITDPFAAPTGFLVYDGDGLLKIEERSTDLDRPADTRRREYSYKDGLLSKLSSTSSTSSNTTRYDYDEQGRLVRQRDKVSEQGWEYEADRLVRYTYEGGNSTSTAYTYDAAGKLEVETRAVGLEVTRVLTYTWVDDQHAEAVEGVDSLWPAGARIYYDYDEQGRLVAETVDLDDNGTIDDGFRQVWHDTTRFDRRDFVFGQVERWVYDDLDRLIEFRDEPELARARTELWEWSCP